jgi:Secretion system C-terminal sorting domain
MKNIFILLILLLSQSLLSQNDSLTIGQVYNYGVGDSLQFRVYHYAIGGPNVQREYKSRQVVIKDKKIDTLAKRMIIHKQVEEFGYVPFDLGRVRAYYQNIHDFESIENTSKKITYSCPPFNNVTCRDSVTLDYGNRKTSKFKYNRPFLEQLEEHHAEGLGLVYRKKTGEDPGYFDDIRLLYLNSKGVKWGERVDVFDVQKPMFKPLTNREVYDFQQGDIFLYLKVFYNFTKGKIDSNYQQITILNRRLTANNDSLIYVVKSELANASSLKQVSVKTDTLSFGQLDSIAINVLKPSSRVFNSDYFFVFQDNKRVTNRRNMVCNCIDFVDDITVAQGIGVTYRDRESLAPNSERLIYYKKGMDTWGTPVILSSITTPSVFYEKIKVFPNPTNQLLNIETEGRFDRLQLTNVYGQISLKQEKTSAIDVSHLPNGIYFLHLFEGQILRSVEKVIVKH